MSPEKMGYVFLKINSIFDINDVITYVLKSFDLNFFLKLYP